MRIGFDLDDVIANLFIKIIEYYNYRFNTNFKIEDFDCFHAWKTWNISRDEAIKVINEFYETHFSDEIKPVAGAQVGIKTLKNHELFIITSRQIEVEKETREWIDKFFPNTFKEIHFTKGFSNNGKVLSKGEVCDKLKIDFFVDDCYDFAKDCLDGKRKVLLLNYPWNKNIDAKEMTRVNSWEGILKEIKNCTKEQV